MKTRAAEVAISSASALDTASAATCPAPLAIAGSGYAAFRSLAPTGSRAAPPLRGA